MSCYNELSARWGGLQHNASHLSTQQGLREDDFTVSAWKRFICPRSEPFRTMTQVPADPDVYMSGPLSAPSDEKLHILETEVYDRVYNLCNDIGLSCYCPHKSETSPSNPISHGEVWDIDHQNVTSSDVLIAYVGIPALGVGAEIEMARAANNEIILLAEYENQDDISRLVLGNPGVRTHLFFDKDNFIEIEEDIKIELFEVFSSKNLKRAAFEDDWDDDKVREMKQRLYNSTKGPARGMNEPMSVEDWIEEAKNDESKQGEQSTLF